MNAKMKTKKVKISPAPPFPITPFSPQGRRDFKEIFDECADILWKEIDYFAEGRNADRFRRNFKNTPWIRVGSRIKGAVLF